MDFSNIVSVAVCDTPAGQYEFLGHVSYPDGTRPTGFQWFDPAIFVEETGNYLYVGSAPTEQFPGMPVWPVPGSMVMRLADDMTTIISTPICIAPGLPFAKGTSFEAHPFFEASSMRRFGDWYYFVYSSLQGHELCYAMSRSPEGPFEYKGVLISNGDLGFNGNTQPQCYLGNNHGGLVQLGGKYYIFWHRHTHGGQFSRQGCADEITMLPDGTFLQAEMTSCGLNGGPLDAANTWRASIACCLQGPDKAAMGMLPLMPDNSPDSTIPYVTGHADTAAPEGYFSYIRNLRPNAVIGYKYFDFGPNGLSHAAVDLQGSGALELRLDSPEGEVLAAFTSDVDDWHRVEASTPIISGVHAVYFTMSGNIEDHLDFSAFSFF